MLIFLVVYFFMGGFWVDYELMIIIFGLYVVGECNFLDYGVNCLGVNFLLQVSVDGYFILLNIINNYLVVSFFRDVVDVDNLVFEEVEKEVKGQIDCVLVVNGNRIVDDFYWVLGKIMW